MARVSEREERGFKYRKRTKEQVRERANMRGGNFDSIIKPKFKMLKVRDGKNIIRILPPTWDDASHYGYDIWVNYGIGADNQSYLSLSKMKDEADPLAEARRAAEKDGDKELSKALQPRQRILMWVIDRNAEEEGPLLWAAPFTLDKAIVNLSLDEDTKEVVYIDDPDDGCDVRFYKEGSGLKTDYDASKIRILKPSPLHDDSGQAQDWLEFVQENPIPDCLQFYDYDHISTAFDGTARTEKKADDDEDDIKPRSRGKAAADDNEDDKPAPRKRAAVQDDDDDTEKPVAHGKSKLADDDDEDKPAPRRSRAVVDDDEDVDDDGVITKKEMKPRNRRSTEDDEEPAEKPSIRDRIRGKRSRIDEDDD